MTPKRTDQAQKAQLSFGEIMHAYGRFPPLRILEYLHVGRRPRATSVMSHRVLRATEDLALAQGRTQREIRTVMEDILGHGSALGTRSLTVDETFALCKAFELSVPDVFSLVDLAGNNKETPS